MAYVTSIGSKPSKLYPNKVTVSKDELYDLLDALRMCAPEEIKRYQKIINNREEILGQAQEQAQQIMSQAQAQTKQLLDQSELVQTAYCPLFLVWIWHMSPRSGARLPALPNASSPAVFAALKFLLIKSVLSFIM